MSQRFETGPKLSVKIWSRMAFSAPQRQPSA